MPDPLRVLYVDDEPGLLAMAKIYLEMNGAFYVDTLTSAKIALDQLNNEHYDAIISDYQMPEMDGIMFLKQLKASGNTTPFIIFTGKGREEVVIEALNEGADFYLQKGGEVKAQFTELANKIRYAVSRRNAEVDLRESEERYRHVVEDQTEFICRFLPDGTHIFVNEAYCRYFELKRDDIIGTRFHPIIHPDDRDHVARLIASLTPGHPLETIAQRIIMPDGSLRWQRWVDRAIFHADGSLKEYQSVGRDITDYKNAEEALQESENKVNAVIRGSPIPQFVIDKNHRVIQWNQALEKYSGISAKEVIGTNQHWRAFYPEERPCMADLLLEGHIEKIKQWYSGKFTKSRFVTGAYEAIDFFPNIRGGTWLHFTAAPIKDLNGVMIGVVETLEDITERKRAEDALRESEIRFREQHQNNPLAIFTWQHRAGDFVLIDFNKAAATLTKGRVKDYLGKFATDLYSSRPEILSEVRQCFSERTVISKELTSEHFLPGRFIKTTATFAPPDMIMVHMEDITERKQVEKRLRESENTFSSIFQGSPVALTLVSALDGKFVNVNDAFIQATGYNRDEVIGTTSGDLGIFANENERDKLAASLRDHHIVEDMEISCRIKNGEIHPCMFSSSMILIGGRPHILSTVRDIRARKQVENALKESEERFRSAMNNLPGTAWSLTGTSDNVLSQGAGLSLIGLKPDEVVGMTLYEFFNTRDPSHPVISQHLRVLAGESVVYEYTHDGITFRTYLSPHHDDSGNIGGVAGLAFDITELKKAEEESRKKDSKFRIILEASTDVIWEVDLLGNFTYVSPQCLDLTGYTPAELIGKPMINLAVPDRIVGLITLFTTSIKEKKASRSFIVPMKHRDGHIIELEIRSVVIFDDNGEVQGFGGIALDITERNRMVESLRQSEEKFRLIVENSHDIIYTLNSDGVFMFVSPVWTTLLGHPVATVTGQSFKKFVHPDDIPGCLEFLRSVIEGGQRLDGIEYRAQHLDGTWYWHTSSAVPTRDETGRIIGFYGIARDITERKKAEDALHLANRKLNLLSSITRHDINNQLTVLMGYLSILQKKPHDPTINSYFLKASTAAERISSIIRFTKEYEEIGVRAPGWENCRAIVDIAAREAPLGEVRLNNDLPSGNEVFADPLILKVFYNLMDNAVRHGGKITAIRFAVEKSGENHVIICEDDGVGIPASEKEQIFERGFGKNTGLGLALSREILAITGITIRETGEPGTGARFEMIMPKGAWRMEVKAD